MRARGYNKKIEVWQTTINADGYGGNGVTNTLISSSWCNIKTPNKNYRSTDDGVTDTTNTLIVTLRKRNDLTYNSLNLYFVYRGIKYIISSEPVNVGFEDRDIQILITKENPTEYEILTPIGQTPVESFLFDNTFDNTFN